MKYKPDFMQLRKALLGGQPERVPLLELAIAQSIKVRFLGEPIDSIKKEIKFYQKAGYDYVKISPLINMNPLDVLPKEGKRISSKTDYTGQREWHASRIGAISNIKDFEKFTFPRVEDIDYSSFENARYYLPDNMKIICQYGDIFTWVWHFLGFETFSYALVENVELIELMFDKIGSIVYDLFKGCLAFDNIGALFYSDDIAINTGLFTSPHVMRTYLFPWMKKIGELSKLHDIPYIYHTDGNYWEVIDDLKLCGINALQAIEPQAMDIVELKQKRGREFCLVGNVDVDLLARGSEEDVIKETKRLLRFVAPGGGFCLGSGNTIADYVKYENYLAMIETAKRYRSYPIEIGY